MPVRAPAGPLQLEPGLGVCTELWSTEPLALLVAAHLSWLHFAPSAELSPSSHGVVEPELALRVGYSFLGPRQTLGTALGLRTYPEYRDVRVNGAAAFRVPAVALTASLEYRFGLRDSRL